MTVILPANNVELRAACCRRCIFIRGYQVRSGAIRCATWWDVPMRSVDYGKNSRYFMLYITVFSVSFVIMI
jgi:hypothetical protein